MARESPTRIRSTPPRSAMRAVGASYAVTITSGGLPVARLRDRTAGTVPCCPMSASFPSSATRLPAVTRVYCPFSWSGHACTARGKPRAEGEGDRHDLGLVADRAGRAGRGPDVAGGAKQLGLGVTDVETGHPPPLELAHDRVAGEAVVDVSRQPGRRAAPQRLGVQAHGARLPLHTEPETGRRAPHAPPTTRRARQPGGTLLRCRYIESIHRSGPT